VLDDELLMLRLLNRNMANLGFTLVNISEKGYAARASIDGPGHLRVLTTVLQQSNLNGSRRQTVNIIHDSAHALLAIIDDILDFTKIEAGKFQADIVAMSAAVGPRGRLQIHPRRPGHRPTS